MASVMEHGEVATARLGQGEARPSRLCTTVYDLIVAIQDAVGPEDDALVVATVVHLLRSGKRTGLGWLDRPY
jgi:hypothetical protein